MRVPSDDVGYPMPVQFNIAVLPSDIASRARFSLITPAELQISVMFRPILRTRAIRPAYLWPTAARSYASATGNAFKWEDPLGSRNLLTEEELAIGETAERYCQEQLLPRVLRK